MASKNISIKESTYERLASLKKEGESFSDLLNRLTRDRSPKYSDLAGILSEKTVENIEKIRKARKETDKREMRKTIKKFGKRKNDR